jgi:hypothetical protein
MGSVAAESVESPITEEPGIAKRLAWISVLLGICSLVALFTVPLLLSRFNLSDAAARLAALIPPIMMLAGLVTGLVARRRKDRSRLASTAVAWNAVLLIGYGAILWTFHSQIRGTATPPQVIFETLIAGPIPETVSHLQGAMSSSFQGYVAYLRFQAPSPASAGFSNPPYEPVDCDEILFYFELADQIRSPFSPDWALPSSPDRTCLQATELRNSWAISARNLVMYADGWVHFASSGD